MKKHTTAAGPTGIARLRSFLAFRHQSLAARLLSTVVAFAIAMLLVASTSPAQADDTAPAPADTSTAVPDPTPTTEDPAPATQDPAPATDEPAPATADPAPVAGQPGADSVSGDAGTADAPAPKGSASSGPMSTTLKKLASPTPNLVGNADCQSSPNTMVGGFEIDADPCDDEGGIDFNGGPGDTTDDGYGDDGNWFTQGSSENDDPSTWTLTGNANTGKADIGTAWAFSHTWHNPGDTDPNTPGDQLDPTDGHVFGYFGFTNDSTAGGTQDYSLEYNQHEPSAGKPVRTVGDLLFHFFANGSNELVYEASYIYTDASDSSWNNDCVESGNLDAGWCPFDLPAGAFTSATSPTGEYVEGAIDITAMFGEGNCSGTFGTTFLRSAPGEFFPSELKDYVAPLDVTTPSTCGKLVITKQDVDTQDPVGGGVYQIVGDPRPDGAGAGNPDYQLCIYDGTDAGLTALQADQDVADLLAAECDEIITDGNADGTVTIDPVEPGTYTVTEIVPPPGYLLNPEPDPGNSETVTVDEGEEQPVAFANHKKWEPLDVTKTADGTFGAQYHWAINKQIARTADGPWFDGTDPQSPLLKDIEAGGDTSLYYKVVVTEESVDTSAYVVSGTIHVANPNDAAVDATISESLSGCTLDSNDAAFPVDVSVPAGGADYDYTCDLGNGPVDPGTNTATVTWDKSTYPQSTDDIGAPGDFSDQGSDGFTFTEVASIDKTVTVTDDHVGFDPAWVITWGDEPDGTYESAVYSFDTETLPGTCSDVITNTATVTGDELALDQDSESGKVCVEGDLSAAVSASASLVRTFNWDIEKSTTTPPPATITVQNGQATAHYLVDVEALPYVDSNWAMTGTVHITNPNDFTDKQVSTLEVAYSGGGTCSLDDALPDVAASGSADVDFHCDFVDPPALDGDVTATVKWDDDAETIDADSATVTEADWVKTLVDEFVKVFDDHAVPGVEDPLFGGTQLRWQDVFDSVDPAAHQVEVEYDHIFSGSILPAAGSCKDLTNTAWLTASEAPVEALARAAAAPENALASDDATVRVCTPAVIVSPPTPPEVSPPGALPNTGGPDAWVLAAGLVLLLGGSWLVIGDRRRRRRS